MQDIEILLSATAGGDKNAFRDLYQTVSPQLFGVALRILKRRDWAEDVLQESFTTIWQRAGDFRPELGNGRAWMTVILRNRALDRLRRIRPVAEVSNEVLEQIPDESASPFEETLRGSDARRLHACLERLEATQKRAILAAYFDGFTHEELSQRLAAPMGTVKSWIRRGLLRLKGCLEL